MNIEGTHFYSPDASYSDLYVRFGEPGKAIILKGQWISESLITVMVPKYLKPDVLRVEITINGKDWTNDGKTYGYFDPFVLRAEPALISVDGTTIVLIKGFGFVNTSSSHSLISSTSKLSLSSQGKPCVREATYIDKNTLRTTTIPQSLVNYNDQSNVLWDAIYIDASISGSNANDFTDNEVEVFYYEEPEYKELSVAESAANIES